MTKNLRRDPMSSAALSLLPLALAAFAAAAAPVVALGKTILVIGTHPDDEILLAAGRIRAAQQAGDTVKIVVVTNGDAGGGGTARGFSREDESVSSANVLGLSEPNVIFLGYPDGSMRQIYDDPSGTTVFTSEAGQVATYGDRGLGLSDYHFYRTGTHAPYTRNAVLNDLAMLFLAYRPDEVYTHQHVETHPDHQAVALLVSEALASLQQQGQALPTRLYQGIVWMPGAGSSSVVNWPQASTSGWTPTVPYLSRSAPCTAGECLDLTTLEWNRSQHFVQPPELVTNDPATNLKSLAVFHNSTVNSSWFASFVRRDEFFWVNDFASNVALTAQVTASSQDSAGGRTAHKAVDGVVGGDVNAPLTEWVTQGEQAGAWIQLTWPSPVRIAQVNLFDRPNPSENVLGGTLLFGDGTSVGVSALPANGRVQPVTFTPRTVSWVRFRIDQAAGTATGLAELQVLGVPASSTANHWPYFVFGPSPASATIPASQSTLLAAGANDLDGDTLQYQWSAEGGWVWPLGGGYATFTPPAVQAETYVAVTATVSDGHGGSASNVTFVDVTPAATDSFTVSPAAAIGPGSAVGQVVLAAPAPAGGTVVALTSDSGAAAAPGSVTVPAGQTTASFGINVNFVTTATPVLLSASLPGGRRGAALRVVPRSVALSLVPTSVLGGLGGQGLVTLPAAAGSGGAVVQLSSGDPAHVSVPASVTVPAGSQSATFQIATAVVTTATNVAISASYGTTSSAVLQVGPLAVSSVSLSPASVIGGQGITGTVQLNGTATASTAVTLASTIPSVATVPASVTVPAGASSATFAVSTEAVGSGTTFSITATLGASSASTPLTVNPYVPPPPAPNLLASPESIGAAPWSAFGDVTLALGAAVAPDGSQHATRAVSSGGGHALSQSVTVVPGTTYTFSFFARNDGGTAASYSVYDNWHYAEIVPSTSYAAQLSGSAYTRVSVTFVTPAGCQAVSVYPVRDSGGPVDVLLWGAKLEVGSSATGYGTLGGASLSLGQQTVLGGSALSAQVTLASPVPAGGAVVVLASNDLSAATVPATVTVPAGATTASFSVTTYATSGARSVQLSASLGGTQVATLLVVPPAVALSLQPTGVLGGSTGQGLVTLPAAAWAGGVVVQLASDDPASASVPATVTVPAGAQSATFSIATAAVAAATDVTLSATFGTTSTAVLQVGPLAVSSVSLSPVSVTGGQAATGTVQLNGTAAASTVVALASTLPGVASVPTSVTVAAGASSASFAVNTVAVTSSTTFSITASMGASSAAAPLTVTPYVPPAPNPNLLGGAETIGATPWMVLGDLTSLVGAGTTPDGTQHATRVVSSGGGHALMQSVTVVPGTTYTLSFFARSNGGTAASYSVYDNWHYAELVPPTSYAPQLNGSAFTRVSVTFTVPAGCQLVNVYPLRDSGGPVDLLLWGAKLETGAASTGFVSQLGPVF